MPVAMVVVAHADDETIALGARMSRLMQACFVHVTDGAPRNERDSRAHGFATLADYRAARREELKSMFRAAGIGPAGYACLEVPDQEASFHLAEISRELMRRMTRWEPKVVFTHPYEGGHPDHDACAFAVHHAVAACERQSRTVPMILESPFYHAGRGEFTSGRFLEAGSSDEVVYQLSPEEREQKHKLIACFTSQQETLRGFHDATERYRIAPAYDFTKAPHPGKLLYENYPWGMTAGRFVELAKAAEEDLAQEGKQP